jgi:hypothetical protein
VAWPTERKGNQTRSGCVRRQLCVQVNDNDFSLPATITDLAKRTSFATLALTGAEDRAMQGCNPSADSRARPGRGRRKPPRRI